MPIYNAEAFLCEAVESVQRQSHHNWELLAVIDNKCSDQSGEIISRFADRDHRIQVIRDKNALGVSNNRNIALTRAKGDYIAFLDADDIWAPHKLATQLAFMNRDNLEFTFHSYQTFKSKTTKTLGQNRMAPNKISYTDLLKHNSIGCLTVMIKKDLISKFKFNETLHEDFCLWLDILKIAPEARGINQVLAYYRISPNSRSGDKIRSALSRWKIIRAREKQPLFSTALFFAHYIYKSLTTRLSSKG